MSCVLIGRSRRGSADFSFMGHLILLNKPYGVVCKFTDAAGRPTLADYISIPHIYPAGRLDMDSEGLLLLTDVGWLQQRISTPRFKLPKRYLVQVEGTPIPAALQRLQDGVTLRDGPARALQARLIAPPALWPRVPPIRRRPSIPTTWLEITLDEGRNRQVRRMTAAVGHPTLRLVRTAIGPWQLGDLASGAWRAALCPPHARALTAWLATPERWPGNF